MRFTADCAPCLMRRVLFQSRLEGNGREFESVKAAVDALSEGMDPDTPSVVIATDVHSRAYAALGSDDPYRRIKEEADVVAAPYERMLEDAVESSDDPLRAAIMAAVVGNIMDFGAGSAIDDPHQFMSVFDGMMSQGLGHDDTDELREELDNVAGVVYMFDNCGESQLDKVLIRQLRRMGKRVVGVVRGAPVLHRNRLGRRPGGSRRRDTLMRADHSQGHGELRGHLGQEPRCAHSSYFEDEVRSGCHCDGRPDGHQRREDGQTEEVRLWKARLDRLS